MAAAPIIAAVIAAGASVYSSEQQAGLARNAEGARKDQQGKLEQERQRQINQAAIDQQKNIDLSRKRTTASVQGGRADTILTSPIGVVGDSNAASKTLLGG
jgi:plasmid stability protein